jgi:hypothetical protein
LPAICTTIRRPKPVLSDRMLSSVRLAGPSYCHGHLLICQVHFHPDALRCVLRTSRSAARSLIIGEATVSAARLLYLLQLAL